MREEVKVSEEYSKDRVRKSLGKLYIRFYDSKDREERGGLLVRIRELEEILVGLDKTLQL